MEQSISYLLVRLALGASMLGHGLVRLPKLGAFSDWMVSIFAGSILPSWVVLPMSYGLPFLEFAIGILLILGLWTRIALVAGSMVMILLIFGSCLVEKWEWLPSQMIHVLFAAVLLVFRSYDHYAINRFREV